MRECIVDYSLSQVKIVKVQSLEISNGKENTETPKSECPDLSIS